MSQTQSRSPYKQAQLDLLDYLDQKVFSVYLVSPHHIPANEIFCFSDGNLAKQHIRGSLRAAIHTALNDPQVYLNVSKELTGTRSLLLKANSCNHVLPKTEKEETKRIILRKWKWRWVDNENDWYSIFSLRTLYRLHFLTFASDKIQTDYQIMNGPQKHASYAP